MSLLGLQGAGLPGAFVLSALTGILLGLCIGSFLNVLIFRLPRRMWRDWEAEARGLLQNLPPGLPAEESLGLCRPPSSCPSCGTRIRGWENIPVLSYVLLRGRCSRCAGAISPRYPIIETATAVLFFACVWRFGLTLQGFSAMLFCAALLGLSVIDYDWQLLPDEITQPLLWLGLLCGFFGVFVNLQDSLLGAVFGYLVLWSVFHLYRLVTGKEGMGGGDFKLLALIGAWLGWQALLPVLLCASLVGSVLGVSLILGGCLRRDQPLPFGPFLAGGGMLYLFLGGWMARLPFFP